MSERGRFEALWETLTSEQQTLLSRDYATRARPTAPIVVCPTRGRWRSRPSSRRRRSSAGGCARCRQQAHLITRALTKLTVDLMEDPSRAPLKQRLFGAFTPLEAEALGATWRKSEQLATVRVDFLVDTTGRARALEVNSTIPAMQGYSDAIAAAFVRAVAAARARPDAFADAVVDDNGRNTDDLLASLLAHHERLGGRSGGAQSIAIVARSGDAQYGELSHYVRRWEALGHRVFIATPEVVRIEDGRAVVDGVIPDSIYRHIFARRLDPASDFARICLEPEHFHLFNPISSHLEVKGMLGLLSAAAADDGDAARIGLDADERQAVAQAVPWTRVLQHGATSGPGGETIDELADWVRAHGRSLVLKRSWDYGGKGVFLGNELADGETARRGCARSSGERRRRWSAGTRSSTSRSPIATRGWCRSWCRRCPSACCASMMAASMRATSTSISRRSPTSATRRGRRAAPFAPRRAASSTSSAAAACRRWCATTCSRACSTSDRGRESGAPASPARRPAPRRRGPPAARAPTALTTDCTQWTRMNVASSRFFGRNRRRCCCRYASTSACALALSWRTLAKPSTCGKCWVKTACSLGLTACASSTERTKTRTASSSGASASSLVASARSWRILAMCASTSAATNDSFDGKY